MPRTHVLQGGDLFWVNHNTRGLRGSPDLQAWSSGLGRGDSASRLEGGGSIRVQASLTWWERHYHEARRGHTSATDQPAPRPYSPAQLAHLRGPVDSKHHLFCFYRPQRARVMLRSWLAPRQPVRRGLRSPSPQPGTAAPAMCSRPLLLPFPACSGCPCDVLTASRLWRRLLGPFH